MFSIMLSCVTEVPAHNYVSEQFGNYVEYGISSKNVNREKCIQLSPWHGDCYVPPEKRLLNDGQRLIDEV